MNLGGLHKNKLTSMTKLLIVIGLIVLIAVVFFSCMASGENAIKKMNDEERKLLEEKVSKIEIGASYESVKLMLGAPNRGDNTERPTWKPFGEGNNQIAIYLTTDGTVRKIRWMKMGKFVWEKI